MSSKIEKLSKKIITRQKKLALRIIFCEDERLNELREEEIKFLDELLNT